jgi:SNF2 family DNA or RNA helicase
MRMVCDSSYILDQKTRFDTKVDECINIISDIISEEGEKVVVFSQWRNFEGIIEKAKASCTNAGQEVS